MSKTEIKTSRKRWLLSVLVVSTAFAVILAIISYLLGYDTINESLTGYVLGALAMSAVYNIPTGGK